jgi:methylated-DNA-[protein]-cysteine S-methyltransferase
MTTTTAPAPVPRPTLLGTALARHDTPIGRVEIHTQFGEITRLDIERCGDLPFDHLATTTSTLHDEAKRQLDSYFEGKRRSFDLPIAWCGTPFQEGVWAAFARVPFGEATSYGELALILGSPHGARAVGGAVRANSVALLVPCHRVLGAGRRVTGYTPGEGVTTKKWLLRHEGIDFIE